MINLLNFLTNHQHHIHFNSDPNNPQNEDWVLEVYSGYENNWVRDKFDDQGNFFRI